MEVVSHTAWTYAAAPGPKGLDANNDDMGSDVGGDEHENTPVQHDCSNSVAHESLHHNEVSRLVDENPPLYEESNSLQGIKLVNKEDTIDMNANLCSFHDVAASLSISTISESTNCTVMLEPSDAAKVDSSSRISKSHNPPKGDNHGLPCEAWWKKGATSWYSQAKDAMALWSVVVAAALLGFVVIGQRWQRESGKGRQLEWHFSISDEKLYKMLNPISQLKYVVVVGAA
ncbi:hypothetical protein MKW94_029317 [Papaver nudicaule]|uniref:Uncharacterized protein n=1 Tax=Papaver nudicaule TaxID=74823 RepID=A0AA41VEK4_PAPNU|nr:hypothetical protein [Papaver nudicaule]